MGKNYFMMGIWEHELGNAKAKICISTDFEINVLLHHIIY